MQKLLARSSGPSFVLCIKICEYNVGRIHLWLKQINAGMQATTSKHQSFESQTHLFEDQTPTNLKSSTDVGILAPAIWKIFCKRFCFKPYKLQMLQTILIENGVK
jgi:hypothetical protein